MANGYCVEHGRYGELRSSQEIFGQSCYKWLKSISVRSYFLQTSWGSRGYINIKLIVCTPLLSILIFLSHVTFVGEINLSNFIPLCSPKCRFEYRRSDTPSRYYCYCGKVEDPPLDPWLVPHSCGQVCERDFKPPCGHKCLLLCHPGELSTLFLIVCGRSFLLMSKQKNGRSWTQRLSLYKKILTGIASLGSVRKESFRNYW